MINTLLVYDENDTVLGDFFGDCFNSTQTHLSTEKDLFIDSVNSRSLNEASILFKATRLNGKPFLFISYSHGSENELLKNGCTPFVSVTNNHTCFVNSFSYCFACSSGKQLGKTLVENGSKCFIGYNKEVYIQLFFNAKTHFVECATHGIKSFFDGKTIHETIVDMKMKYTEKIDEFYKKDMLTASLFLHNRDAIISHGDTSLKIDSFIV